MSQNEQKRTILLEEYRVLASFFSFTDTVDRLNIKLENYPAIQIGRLAVDEKWRRRGIGTFICNWVLGLSQEFAQLIVCRFVVLNAKEESISFIIQIILNCSHDKMIGVRSLCIVI